MNVSQAHSIWTLMTLLAGTRCDYTASRDSRLLATVQVQSNIRLTPWRNVNALAPLGSARLIRGTDGVLPFGQKRKPEATVGIGFRGLEMTTVRGLQRYAGVRYRSTFQV